MLGSELDQGTKPANKGTDRVPTRGKPARGSVGPKDSSLSISSRLRALATVAAPWLCCIGLLAWGWRAYDLAHSVPAWSLLCTFGPDLVRSGYDTISLSE